jgi:hypothetical protein
MSGMWHIEEAYRYERRQNAFVWADRIARTQQFYYRIKEDLQGSGFKKRVNFEVQVTFWSIGKCLFVFLIVAMIVAACGYVDAPYRG